MTFNSVAATASSFRVYSPLTTLCSNFAFSFCASSWRHLKELILVGGLKGLLPFFLVPAFSLMICLIRAHTLGPLATSWNSGSKLCVFSPKSLATSAFFSASHYEPKRTNFQWASSTFWAKVILFWNSLLMSWHVARLSISLIAVLVSLSQAQSETRTFMKSEVFLYIIWSFL